MDGQPNREPTPPARDPLEIRPGPALQGETQFRERMNEESPDGRPPEPAVRRESLAVFWTFLILIAIAVIVALVWRGGWITGITAIILFVLFVPMAAWATWHAGLDRKLDERRVTDEIRAQNRSRGIGGHAGHPM